MQIATVVHIGRYGISAKLDLLASEPHPNGSDVVSCRHPDPSRFKIGDRIQVNPPTSEYYPSSLGWKMAVTQ